MPGCAQPRLNHVSGAAGQDANSLPGRGVDQHGCVLLAAAQREFVEAEDARDPGLREQDLLRGIPRDRAAEVSQRPASPGSLTSCPCPDHDHAVLVPHAFDDQR
jgi:hypothetical protein